MTDDPNDSWPSGVAGAQCDECGETTIVRSVGHDALGEPDGWLCRPCWTGEREEEPSMSTDEPTREEIEAAAKAWADSNYAEGWSSIGAASRSAIRENMRPALTAAREVRSENAIKAEALREAAAELPHVTEGVNRVGTSRWSPSARATYSLAIEEAQAALRARADEIEGGVDD